MESYQGFFSSSALPHSLCQQFMVNTINCSTFQANHLSIGFDKSGCLWLTAPDKKGQVVASSQMTIQPIFNPDRTPQVSIQQIYLHVHGEKLTVRSEDKSQLGEIYQKLKVKYPHTGFGDYFRPIKKLGKGAFASVYLVQHKITKERFAAKVFSKEGQNLEFKGKQALQNQIRTLRELRHPNIIQFYGVFQTENLVYLITQYLSGGTLEEVMRDRCQVTGNLIEKVIKNTLEALCYLQKQKVMHRDLKPQNLLLRESDGRWVLADFGLSAYVEEDCIYEVCGTMGYIAPQILASRSNGDDKKKHHYNSSCDMYSLGVIGYNLIVGSFPFKFQAEGLDKKIQNDGFEREEFKLLEPVVRRFIFGLMEKQPSKRTNPLLALKDKFFIDSSVKEKWYAHAQKRINERYEKILQIANVN